MQADLDQPTGDVEPLWADRIGLAKLTTMAFGGTDLRPLRDELLSKLAGAFVIGSDPMPERRAKSLSLGADLALNPRDGQIADEIRSRTDGRGADVVLVAVPIPAALTEALAIARPGGRILLFAQNDPQLRIEFPAAAVGVEEKEILGSYSAAVDRQNEAARLIFSRQLPVRELVTQRFSLEDINRALELAAHPINDSLKVVVQP